MRPGAGTGQRTGRKERGDWRRCGSVQGHPVRDPRVRAPRRWQRQRERPGRSLAAQLRLSRPRGSPGGHDPSSPGHGCGGRPGAAEPPAAAAAPRGPGANGTWSRTATAAGRPKGDTHRRGGPRNRGGEAGAPRRGRGGRAAGAAGGPVASARRGAFLRRESGRRRGGMRRPAALGAGSSPAGLTPPRPAPLPSPICMPRL